MLESQIYGYLEKYGFDIPKYRVFAIDELTNIDFYPVALKIESQKIIHKSEFGAIMLNIASPRHLEKARKVILKNIKAKGIILDAADRFLAVEMITGDELYAGVVNDAIFGHTILFGKGGIFLELYRDVCYIDLEAKEEEILRALKKTRISKIFEGFRGRKASYQVAIDCIKKLQRLVRENPSIAELDLNPMILREDKLTVIDARIRQAPPKEHPPVLRKRSNFFENKSVAIIGASAEFGKVGYAVAKNALSFKGNIFFVNRKGGEILGKKAYMSVLEIKQPIDMAVIVTPASSVVDEVKKLANIGTKNIIIISAGFAEVGNIKAQEQIRDLAITHNLNIIGPNCLGYYDGLRGLNLTFGTSDIRHGSIALLSQSGAVLAALMDKAAAAGIGFSHIISLGNMCDLDFAELIDMLQYEKSCRAISIYAEGIREGKKFLRALRDSKKPIYIYKTGKSEEAKKAAFSHTGNISGDYNMFKGLIESTGSKIEDNIEALLYTPHYNAQNILVVTNAGGPASILADLIASKGKKLHDLTEEEIKKFDAALPFNWSRRNPIDIIGDAMSDRYEKALKIAESIEEIDLIYLVLTPQLMTDSLNIAKLSARKWKKRIIPVFLGESLLAEAKAFFRHERILFFDTLEGATCFLS